jgi:hypothetical protein
MASIPLPGIAATHAAAERLQAELREEDRIEVPIVPFPVSAARDPGAGPAQLLVRVSAQVYNRPSEYEALAAALARRLRTASGPRSLLGRLRRA